MSNVDGTDEPSAHIDIAHVEKAVIGEVAIQWSFLEFTLLEAHKYGCEVFGEDLPKEAHSIAFKRRLRSYFEFLKRHRDELAHFDELEEIRSQAANLSIERHKVVHGVWDWSVKEPAKLRSKSILEGAEFEEEYSVEDLWELSQRIGRVSLKLFRISNVSQRLNQTGFAKKDGSVVGYVHRSFYLSEEERKFLYPEFNQST